jgi:hypothetical protein
MLKYLLLLLLSTQVLADEMFLNYGLGVGPSALNSMIETKTVDLGYRYYLLNSIYWQNKFGYWVDNSGNPARHSSAYDSSGLGIVVTEGPVEVRSGIGVAIISTTDAYLGGMFPNFNENLGVGIRDNEGAGFGLDYQHLSSGGIYEPNIGRDFVTLEFSLRW